jgi:hypothetical protein
MVTMQYSREHVAKTLRMTGFPKIAEEALRVLPDPADEDEIAAFLAPHGVTFDDLIDRLGGTNLPLSWPDW